MSINDFYVAIQFLLEDAHKAGFSLMQIESFSHDAIEEFISEMEKDSDE